MTAEIHTDLQNVPQPIAEVKLEQNNNIQQKHTPMRLAQD
jgi:hypothetical protein